MGSYIDRYSFDNSIWPEKSYNGKPIVDIRDMLFKPGTGPFKTIKDACITFDDPNKKDEPEPEPTPEPSPLPESSADSTGVAANSSYGWRFVPVGYAKQIMDDGWKIKYW